MFSVASGRYHPFRTHSGNTPLNDARCYAFCGNLHTLRDEFPAFLHVRLLAFSYDAEHRLVDGGQFRLFAGILDRFLYGRFDLF